MATTTDIAAEQRNRVRHGLVDRIQNALASGGVFLYRQLPEGPNWPLVWALVTPDTDLDEPAVLVMAEEITALTAVGRFVEVPARWVEVIAHIGPVEPLIFYGHPAVRIRATSNATE